MRTAAPSASWSEARPRSPRPLLIIRRCTPRPGSQSRSTHVSARIGTWPGGPPAGMRWGRRRALRQNRVVLARQADRSVRCGSSRSTAPDRCRCRKGYWLASRSAAADLRSNLAAGSDVCEARADGERTGTHPTSPESRDAVSTSKPKLAAGASDIRSTDRLGVRYPASGACAGARSPGSRADGR